jgi:hypothetical protein
LLTDETKCALLALLLTFQSAFKLKNLAGISSALSQSLLALQPLSFIAYHKKQHKQGGFLGNDLLTAGNGQKWATYLLSLWLME